MSLRGTCEKKMQAQLNELKAEIAELKEKSEYNLIWDSLRELVKSITAA